MNEDQQPLNALRNELREARAQQVATSEVLKVISGSPGDLRPIFDAVLRNATSMCGAHLGILNLYDGEKFRTGAQCGGNPEFVKWLFERGAWAPLVSHAVGRMVAERRPVHVLDLRESQAYREGGQITVQIVDVAGARTFLTVPLITEGKVIGNLGIYRPEVLAFTERQIALVQTFADQAAIAIENARLFNETKEALEQQTATAEILRVISSSPTNTQPVFDAIVKSCARLFVDTNITLRLVREDMTVPVASTLSLSVGGARPNSLSDETLPSTLAIRRGEVVHVPDVLAIEGLSDVSKQRAEARGFRAMLSAPLRRENIAIGAINVTRATAGPFTDKQIALLKTFADQAVIAIENVRLFKELQSRNAEVTESLEQQTAISEILRVISSSPTDIQPVLNVVAESATHYCGANDALIRLADGESSRVVAHFGSLPVPEEARLLKTVRETLPGRAMLECRTIHIPDTANEQTIVDYPEGSLLSSFKEYRSRLVAPLLREGVAVGVIALRREEARPFSNKQIRLLETFASQAAIAIENARLFNETREALEQRTATSEILRVISSSPTDTQPVFEAIVKSGAHLFGGLNITLRIVKGDRVERVASTRPLTQQDDQLTLSLSDDGSPSSRAVLRREVVHIPNVSAEPWISRQTMLLAEHRGWRAMLCAPMVRGNDGIGAVSVTRAMPGPFTEKQIALVKTFAAQAVIAIENVRLFNEIQDKSRQLQVASQHKSEFLANMSHELRTPLNAVIGFSEVLQQRMFGDLTEKQGEYIDDIHSSGQHLLSLINDILDLSKIEAGRMELDVSTFSVPMAIDNALTLIKERAGRHGIALDCNVDPGVGDIDADERKMKQILLNLLSNAVKFTPDGGRISVAAVPIDGGVEVSVSDTGIGIAPEDCAAVFEEFRQVGQQSDAKAEGTGLGLALARKFIELHGGKIGVSSEVGEGSTFTFSLLNCPLQQSAGA